MRGRDAVEGRAGSGREERAGATPEKNARTAADRDARREGRGGARSHRLAGTSRRYHRHAGDGSTSGRSGGPDFYSSVQPLSDGRIAALVELGRNTLRVHAEASGAPDPSFAMGGIQAFPVGSYPRLAAVNGDIVLVGFTDGGYDIYRMSRTDGALRTDFDADGIARVNVAAGRTLSSSAVRVDAQGRMTVVGASSPDGFSPGQIVITRVWM